MMQNIFEMIARQQGGGTGFPGQLSGLLGGLDVNAMKKMAAIDDGPVDMYGMGPGSNMGMMGGITGLLGQMQKPQQQQPQQLHPSILARILQQRQMPQQLHQFNPYGIMR